MDLIAFVEAHLTLIASLIAVMASLGSVYMVADRRWGKLESSVTRMETAITTEIATVAGCAANELAHIKFSRDPAEVSTRTDTMTGDARMIGVEMTLRRTMQ